MTTIAPNGITIKWIDADLRSEGKDDPAFYVWNSNNTTICVVSNDTGYEVEVCCDGEMKAILNQHIDHATTEYVRYCDEWAEYGINNDAELADAEEKGIVEWAENAWFDLYDNEGTHLDCVSHTLTEAIQNAVSILDEYCESKAQDLD